MTEYKPLEEIPSALTFELSFNDLRKTLKLTRMRESTALFLLSPDRFIFQTIGMSKCQADAPYSVPPPLEPGQLLGLATRSDILMAGLINEDSLTSSDVVRFSIEGQDAHAAFIDIAWGNTQIRQRCTLVRQIALNPTPSPTSMLKSSCLTESFRALESFARRPPKKGESEPVIEVANSIAKVYLYPWYAQWEDPELGETASLSISSRRAEVFLPALKEWQEDVAIASSDGQLSLVSPSASYLSPEGTSQIPDVNAILQSADAVSVRMPTHEFRGAMARICSQMPPNTFPMLDIKVTPSESTLYFEMQCPDGAAKLQCSIQLLSESTAEARSATVRASAIHSFSKNCLPDADVQMRFIDGAIIFDQHVGAKRRLAILATERAATGRPAL